MKDMLSVDCADPTDDRLDWYRDRFGWQCRPHEECGPGCAGAGTDGARVDLLLGGARRVGALAMALGMAVSIPLFSNQSDYVGALAKSHPALGDLTFEVGFVIAALVYVVGFRLIGSRPAAEPAVVADAQAGPESV